MTNNLTMPKSRSPKGVYGDKGEGAHAYKGKEADGEEMICPRLKRPNSASSIDINHRSPPK